MNGLRLSGSLVQATRSVILSAPGEALGSAASAPPSPHTSPAPRTAASRSMSAVAGDGSRARTGCDHRGPPRRPRGGRRPPPEKAVTARRHGVDAGTPSTSRTPAPPRTVSITRRAVRAQEGGDRFTWPDRAGPGGRGRACTPSPSRTIPRETHRLPAGSRNHRRRTPPGTCTPALGSPGWLPSLPAASSSIVMTGVTPVCATTTWVPYRSTDSWLSAT